MMEEPNELVIRLAKMNEMLDTISSNVKETNEDVKIINKRLEAIGNSLLSIKNLIIKP